MTNPVPLKQIALYQYPWYEVWKNRQQKKENATDY